MGIGKRALATTPFLLHVSGTMNAASRVPVKEVAISQYVAKILYRSNHHLKQALQSAKPISWTVSDGPAPLSSTY